MGRNWSAGGAAILVAALTIAPAHAAESACADALSAFDAKYDERTDEEALAAARALVASCPGQAAVRPWSRVAMIFYHRRDFPQAIEAFQKAIDAKPDPRMYMSLCGVYSDAGRKVEALETCRAGLKLAKAMPDSSPVKRDDVLDLGYNTALVRVRLRADCDDHTVYEMFDAYRQAHPDNGFVHQMLGAWVWDCEHDFERGLALYKKSCELGHQPACEQVKYTEACQCQEHKPSGR